jgi:triosephosphate isomerase
MKKILIVGNWKMHLNVHEASALLKRLDDHIQIHRDIEVVLAPNMLTLASIARDIDHRKFKLASQNAYYKDEGAYTGEVSFTMLRDIVDYAIIGHSERRIFFNESLETIRDKVTAAIRNGIKPILCIGETKQDKQDGETKRVIHDQLTTALSNLTAEELNDVIVAYEPVWAISTFNGQLAKPSEIKPIVDLVRMNISELYGAKAGTELKLIYGGSVDDQTALGYLQIEGIDGLLPGSASLNYKKFSSIVDSAYRSIH